MSWTLLLVDVQNDFHPGGSLAIPSADEDSERLATFLSKHWNKIDRIVETMDTHHELHIAHSGFWIDVNGNHPDSFTMISSNDIESGKWKPIDSLQVKFSYEEVEGGVNRNIFDKSEVFDCSGNFDLTKYCIEYTRQLESSGRFQLIIWPDHCIVGTPGHNVVPCVKEEMTKWVKKTGHSIEWVHKGQNILTEMYSVMKADVPVTESTSFNHTLMKSLLTSKKLLIAGQSLSHCVNSSVRDIVAHWPNDETHKICILTDCSSSVPGSESAGEEFLKDMKDAGVKLCSSTDDFDDE